MLYKNLRIILEDKVIENGNLEIIDGKISRVFEGTCSDEGIDSKGLTAIPGFIDIHTHGGYGYDFMDKNLDGMNNYLINLAKEGVTGVVQCTITDTWDNTLAVAKWYGENKKDFTKEGTQHIGIHHEGIFMAKEKKGAHNEKLFLGLDPQKVIDLQKESANNIKIITYAAEFDKDGKFTKTMRNNGIVASMGHTNATYKEAELAFNNGANSVTHLFNAMKGISHREPSVALAALMIKDLHTEIICDGLHVSPEMVNFAYINKGYKKLICITDSLSMKGLKDGEYKSGGFAVFKEGNSIKMENGTIAGGAAQMIDCFKNIQEFTKCSIIEACHMCSTNQAELLNINDQVGSIKENKLANIVLINNNNDVVKTIIEGRVVYENNSM